MRYLRALPAAGAGKGRFPLLSAKLLDRFSIQKLNLIARAIGHELGKNEYVAKLYLKFTDDVTYHVKGEAFLL